MASEEVHLAAVASLCLRCVSRAFLHSSCERHQWFRGGGGLTPWHLKQLTPFFSHSSDGRTLVSASRDKTVKILRCKDLGTITTIVAGVTQEGAALMRFEDTDYIVAVGDAPSVRVWDMSGQEMMSRDTYDGEVVTKLLYRGGSAFAVATQDHNFLQYVDP